MVAETVVTYLSDLYYYLLPDSSTSIVFRTRAIVSVVYSIVFSANPAKPYERCMAPHTRPTRGKVMFAC